MRLPVRLALLTLLACPLFVFAAVPSGMFSTTLVLGSRGSDVLELQTLLNMSPDTLIASSGPGSPGMETTYFGSLTLGAVERFQSKFRADVLVPNGLLAPTGIVGPSTRLQLLKLLNQFPPSSATATVPTSTPPPAQSATPPAETAAAPTPLASILGTSSPEDLYIQAVESRLAKNGVASSSVALVEAKIRATAASSTNLQQQFFDQQQKFYKKASDSGDPAPIAFVKSVLSSVGWFFAPQTAHAAVTALPMGGYIVYVNPLICDCTLPPTTQLFVALPLANPLVSNLLLNYVDGSEAFSWHNIPEPGISVLGLYEPAVPSCWTIVPAPHPFCVPIPADGLITPVVGSSPSAPFGSESSGSGAVLNGHGLY